jgi:prevent-host-death family protein
MGKTVSIRELQRDTSGVVRRVASTGRPAIVTNRGDPVVALVPVDRDALEDFVLANSPPYVRAMREADAALETGRVRPASEVFAELGDNRDHEQATESRREIRLTARELEILSLLAQGRTAQALAKELGISAGTAKAHIAHALDKLASSTGATAGTR